MNRPKERIKWVKKVSERLQSQYNLRKIRSISELVESAHQCGFPMSIDSVSKYLRGEIEPGSFPMAGLCAALNVSADKILFGKPDDLENKIHDMTERIGDLISDDYELINSLREILRGMSPEKKKLMLKMFNEIKSTLEAKKG